MATKATVKDALQAAIGDYNTWALDKGKDYDAIKAYGEIRGIFYNKLLSRLKELEDISKKSSYSRYRAVIATDLACVFDPVSKYLINLVVPPRRGWICEELLTELSKACIEVEYDYFISPLYLGKEVPSLDPLGAIVNSIKSYKI